MNDLIDFTNLLHRFGTVDALEVQKFLSAHQDDAVFQQRAQTVIQGFNAGEIYQQDYA